MKTQQQQQNRKITRNPVARLEICQNQNIRNARNSCIFHLCHLNLLYYGNDNWFLFYFYSVAHNETKSKIAICFSKKGHINT